MPAISVIVPLFNTESFVKDCLDSLVAQTFNDFEVIIIDDGSTDNSARIAAGYASSDARFRLIGQPNKGLSEARNTGLKIARGEYVTFVDSDDCVTPNFLELMLSIAKEQQADIVCCNFQNVNEEFKITESCTSDQILSKTSTCLTAEKATAIALYQDSLPDYSAWNKLYRTSLWNNQKFEAGIYFEDFAVIPDILLLSNKVAITKDRLYLYRKRTNSILSTSFSTKKLVLLDIAERVLDKMTGKSKPLYKAARSMLVSASFSILMRTDDTEEFAEYRKKALAHIHEFRLSTFFDFKVRMRTRMAILISYLPRFMFLKLLKKGH